MPGFLLHLTAPWQAWPAPGLFHTRPTMRFPTRSALTGLIGAALGIRRDPNTGAADLSELHPLRYTVRIDRPGSQRRDFHTVGGGHEHTVPIAEGGTRSGNGGTLISERWYLADAAFTVAVHCDDTVLTQRCTDALRAPVFPLYLGRRGFVPSYPPLLLGPIDAPQDELERLPLNRHHAPRPYGSDTPGEALIDYVLDTDPNDGGPPGSRVKDDPLPGRLFGHREVWNRTRTHLSDQCLGPGQDWLDRLDTYFLEKAAAS
ncbi:type I-E CRISPR-associated protein Cas5/CasD [Streptomyces caniferus]|uniref:type I-E CRISPR-associated protein Cas5/CasD n=1 Tax=Streptomyces caniferus TaxID=285557 RepID=UPI00381BA513